VPVCQNVIRQVSIDFVALSALAGLIPM